MWNVVSPHRSLRGSQGRKRHATVMRVEDRGESERPTVMVGIRIAILSDAKAGRLPLGFRSRENSANRLNRIGRCFTSLCHKNPSWVLEGDIKGCFDNISH